MHGRFRSSVISKVASVEMFCHLDEPNQWWRSTPSLNSPDFTFELGMYIQSRTRGSTDRPPQQTDGSAGLPRNRRSTPKMGSISQESSKIDISGKRACSQSSLWLVFSQQFQALLKNGNMAFKIPMKTSVYSSVGKSSQVQEDRRKTGKINRSPCERETFCL